MRLTSGTKLGSYEVVGELGAGGMGEVYLARDLRLGREVALKILPQEVASDPERLSRFEREARTIAALNHPNIVTLHAVEDAQGMPFLVMERVAGRPLSELIPVGGLAIDRLIEVAAPIADALSAAHEKSVVHRDLKPANVMVSDDGLVKVLDFGLATTQAPPQSGPEAGTATFTQTAAGRVVGTVPYMAPEQLRGERVDARTDIFAFGTMLYEMATGIRPFRGDSAADVMSAILREEPRPIAEVRPDLPARFARLVERCLDKNPRRRVQSAIDLRHELDDVADEMRRSSAAQPPPPTGPLSQAAPADRAMRPGATSGRKRAALIASALLALSVVAAAIFVVTRQAGPVSGGAIRSLAVLPFENMNHDAAQDYFVDGMHEALITDLVKLGTLKVISRNAVLRFRNRNLSMREIARELGVEALVQGSVLRAGSQVRITAQLILGASDEQVWGTSYDRDLQDVLKLLGDVSRAIAGEIQARLGGAAAPAARAGDREAQRVRPEAYDAFLRGRLILQEGLGASVLSAFAQFELAANLDPTFAPAWGNMAVAQLMLGLFSPLANPDGAAEARRLAQKALDLDPNDGAGLAVKGMLQLYIDWDFRAAQSTLERAVALNPHDAQLRHGIADYLMTTGRFDESLAHVKIGRDANPTAPLPETVVLFHTMATRRFDDVIAEARRAMLLFPSLKTSSSGAIVDALWRQKKFDESMAETKAAFGSDTALQTAYENGYKSGGPAGARRAYAEYRAAKATSPRNALDIAGAYADAGDRDKAMEWLEKAFAARLPTLLHVVATPAFDSMHDDPRYRALLRRIGIPSAAVGR
jgi:TolB-like protein